MPQAKHVDQTSPRLVDPHRMSGVNRKGLTSNEERLWSEVMPQRGRIGSWPPSSTWNRNVDLGWNQVDEAVLGECGGEA